MRTKGETLRGRTQPSRRNKGQGFNGLRRCMHLPFRRNGPGQSRGLGKKVRTRVQFVVAARRMRIPVRKLRRCGQPYFGADRESDVKNRQGGRLPLENWS